MGIQTRSVLGWVRRDARRSGRALAGTLATLLAVGGIPGTRLRSAAPAASDGAAPQGRVVVTVHDGPGGPVRPGARVRAFAMQDDRAAAALEGVTDTSGTAILDGLLRGETWIVAEAPARARATVHVVLDGQPRALALALELEHSIDVVVKDERGAPVGGAEIEARAEADADALPVGARSTPGGAVHVGRLGAGPWTVAVRAPGYEEATARAAEGEVLSVVLHKLGSFAVHVVLDGEKPASGAHVSVAGAALWPPRAADADADGDVRIGGLAAGTYAFRASRGDLVSPIEFGVPLDRGEDRQVVLRLAAGRFVGVRVCDSDADDAVGIGKARVTLAEGGVSPFPIEATTDAGGRVRLGPIAPGAATLSARAEGFVARAVSLADPAPREVRVVLWRAGVLGGRVVDDRGFPVAGATIEIVGSDPNGSPVFDDPRRASFQAAHFDAMLAGPTPLVPGGELGVLPGPVPPIPMRAGGALEPLAVGPAEGAPRSARSDPWLTRADGEFRAAPASPGRIRAVVRHPLYVDAESDIVTLAPGGEARVDVVMQRGGALEGRVVDSRDRPVAGARVVAASTRGALERMTRTAGDGTFAFAALPDEVSVTASSDDEDALDVHMALSVPEGGRRQLIIRLPAARGSLPVAVVDDRDFPIAGAQVSASSLSADVPLRQTAFTDASGAATLKRARGLSLRIEATAPGRAPVVVTEDAHADAVRIVLVPAESATGEVVAAMSGAPVADGDVSLYTDTGVRRARTDARGAYVVPDLAPGAVTLRVRAPGFAGWSRAAAVADSGGRRPTEMPRAELAEAGVLEGDVVDARGDPVAGARVAKDRAPTWLSAGADADGVAVTDARGRFSLGELAEGTIAVEAYAADVGRARLDGVRIVAGSTTRGAHIVLGARSDEPPPATPHAAGSVAVTLGETGAPVQVVVASVAPASAAERAGLAPGDVLLAVDGAPVATIEAARERLNGALSDDAVVRVRRGDRELAMRVPREPVRR